MDTLNDKLQPLREKIDELDAELLQLLNRRAAIAQQVGDVKKEFDAPVFRPERERQVIAALQQANPGPLQADGPAGTFTEQAAHAHFGRSVAGVPCPSIDDVFRTVEAGGADYGVVPVENSTEGAITRTLDLLQATPLSICGEVALPIHHNLLTQSGSLDGVRVIRAHAQALAQCQQWLATHYPALPREAVASNAAAAREAAADPTVAAIGGEAAATVWGLQIADPHIQDDPANRTRFFVVGRRACAPTGADRTTLVLWVDNAPGAVYRLLEPLAHNGVSMSRLEARPARSGQWEYCFHIDVEGHQADPAVAAALAGLAQRAAQVKILGSYPSADGRQ